MTGRGRGTVRDQVRATLPALASLAAARTVLSARVDVQTLTDRFIGATGRQAQWAAGQALAALGAPAVGPLVGVLCDEGSPVDWAVTGQLLRGIGRPALEPLVEAMASAPTPEVARRAGWAHCGLRIDDLSAFVPGLRHPSAKVRGNSAYVLQLKGEAALPYVPELIPLLNDSDADVRERAVWALQGIGPGVVPLLREVRRSRTAGRLRRPALEALAAVGGPDALDERDRGLIRRLIRMKIAAEVPEPMHLCGTWFAVPTGDQVAVLDAFGLSDAEPVTMRLGASAWNHDHHDWSGPDGGHRTCSRVYVSPRLDGWTLVFGRSAEDAHPRDPDQGGEAGSVERERCRTLSRRFGAAHWYGMSCGDGWTAWCVAEHGEIVRYYDAFEPDDRMGPPHPAEQGYLLPDEDGFPEGAFDDVDPSDPKAYTARYTRLKRELGIPDTCDATLFAARASTDPSSFGPDTRVEGHGVLALTACGRAHGHPRGALRI